MQHIVTIILYNIFWCLKHDRANVRWWIVNVWKTVPGFHTIYPIYGFTQDLFLSTPVSINIIRQWLTLGDVRCTYCWSQKDFAYAWCITHFQKLFASDISFTESFQISFVTLASLHAYFVEITINSITSCHNPSWWALYISCLDRKKAHLVGTLFSQWIGI